MYNWISQRMWCIGNKSNVFRSGKLKYNLNVVDILKIIYIFLKVFYIIYKKYV
jgi:hypothetical protein